MYEDELEILRTALAALAEGHSGLPKVGVHHDWERIRTVLVDTARHLHDNYPYHHPLYAGQMLKPPHPVARLAYALSLWVNPNNHALDGGRASSAMEKSVVRRLAGIYGWSDCLGHLSGGGTMANLEALWVAGRLHPGKTVLSSTQAHYTHARISEVLGLAFESVAATADGRMDLAALEQRLAAGGVGTIVATIGTTGLGAVDPLPDIVQLARRHGARVHADAAYGGYFGLCAELKAGPRAAYKRLADVDSLVVDPHKHGLQPYGCGSVLFRDPSVGRFYKHGSPYTYFSSTELHLGEISLECSRPGAAAVALWATLELLPLEAGGEFSRMLDTCLDAARAMHALLTQSSHFVPVHYPDLDIVVYAVARDSYREAGAAARRIFERAAERNLHLALIELPATMVAAALPGAKADSESLSCLRSVLMKPAHADSVPEIVRILNECARDLRQQT